MLLVSQEVNRVYRLPLSRSRDYKHLMATGQDRIEAFIAEWRNTGGSELANTQSFIHGLANLLGVDLRPVAKP
ncbi:MAG: hypothetical protein C0471_06200 [Erythrobacter sp.]|nr:hypothetical protein [Erythrobacter sp.]